MRARKRLCCGQEHNVRCGGGGGGLICELYPKPTDTDNYLLLSS